MAWYAEFGIFISCFILILHVFGHLNWGDIFRTKGRGDLIMIMYIASSVIASYLLGSAIIHIINLVISAL